MGESLSAGSTADVGGHIGIKHLWKLQEQASSYNCQGSKFLQGVLDLLDRSVRLNLSILGDMRFGPEKQTAIRVFGVDALSHIIIAARIGMWGALPESLSVLRTAVEDCAQLALTVNQKLYNTALLEIKGNRLVRLRFNAACNELGELGSSLRDRHSKISNLASHSTSRSLRQEEYDFGSETCDRLGSAHDSQKAEIAASECLEIGQLIAVSLLEAYKQDGIALQAAWLATLDDVHTSHKSLKDRISASYGDSNKDQPAPDSNA